MPGKKVVILQSNYIPWKGYFDLIRVADEFIFYDDVQYTVGDWRNRNRIKTSEGSRWITIPVGNDIKKLICEIEIKDDSWKEKHERIIRYHYKYAPFFSEYEYIFKNLYHNQISNLSEYNQSTIKFLSNLLGIKTSFSDSRNFKYNEGKTERLIGILQEAKATDFICGPSAKSYLKEDLIKEAGINLSYFNYGGYPHYPQLYGPFVQEVSVIDLIFNAGPDALKYMKKVT